MFCKNCGAEISDGLKFCPKCGTPNPTLPATQQSVVEQPVVEQPVVEPPVIQPPVFEQPVTMQPATEQPVFEQPVMGKQKIKKPSKILSLLCWILIFCTALVFMASYTVGNSLTTDNLKDAMMDAIDTESIVGSIDSDMDISDKQLAEIYEIEEIEEFVISTFYEIALEDKSPENAVEKLVEIIKNHEDEIEEIFGEKITDADYDELTEECNKMMDEVVEEFDEDSNDAIEIIRAIVDFGSLPMMLMFALILAFLCVAMYFIRIGKANGLTWSGTALSVSGLLFMLLLLLEDFILTILPEDQIVADLVTGIVCGFFDAIQFISSAAVVLGVVMIIGNIIIKSTKSKNA